jgi:hypothetical protein
MAGFGWYPTASGLGIEVSGDGQTATRPTDGGGASSAGIRGAAGRSKGRRYFEVECDASCSVGLVDINADFNSLLGNGSDPLQWGFLLQNGYFYYNDTSGSGSDNKGTGAIAASVIGALVDFDVHSVTIYSNGVELFTQALGFALDVALYPAVSLEVGGTASLQSIDAFQYPPEASYVPWDKPDQALGSRVSGTILVDGVPAARYVKAFSYERLPFSINNKPVTESKPLGQSISDETTGDYEIILRDGFPRDVFVVAFDNYGAAFQADSAVAVMDVLHPTIPNGYVYVCNGSGELPSVEPDPWPTDTESSQSIGTASFDVRPFYRPEVHGPVVPEVVDVDVGEELPLIVASVYSHGVMVKNDGTVVCWGDNSYDKATPPEGVSDVVSAQAGNNYSYALKTDGTVVAWGRNYNSALNVPTDLDDAIQISVGFDWAAALKTDGTVVAWGINDYAQVSGVAPLSNVKQIACGRAFGIAVHYDGTISHWGRDIYGLASGAASRSGIIYVACSTSGYFCAALKSDGTVTCWGENSYGQTSTPGGLADVVQVATGSDYTYALKADGTLASWGRNHQGQRNTPGGLPVLAQISCQYLTSVAISFDGQVSAWGYGAGGIATPPAGVEALAPNQPKA